jgi:hypothetical protein
MNDNSNNKVDTLSRSEYELDISQKKFHIKYTHKTNSKKNHSGDTVKVTLKFESSNQLLAKCHTTEILSRSKNIKIIKVKLNEFYMIIDSTNTENHFIVQPYIKSNRVIFEDAYFDTLGSILGPKYNSAVGSYSITYPIDVNK